MSHNMNLLKPFAIVAVSIAILVPANAAFVCTVADPTGTPLNVRSQPNGTILGALHNGAQVIIDDVNDWKWVKIIPVKSGKTGWVFFNFLDCN
jgi:hypothetical protein